MCAAFKRPNLKAPRFREKKLNLLNMKLFNEFKKKHKEHKDLSYAQFKEIITVFNETLYNGVIENRNGIELPEKLGYVFIGTCPPTKRKNVDYKKSIEYGVLTNHKNWDSDNHLMKIFYTCSKMKYHLPNRQLWAFAPGREFKRTASAVYKQEWAKYIVVDNTKRIAAMITMDKKIKSSESYLKYRLSTYDEFKM
jgi:hypothetical protein